MQKSSPGFIMWKGEMPALTGLPGTAARPPIGLEFYVSFILC